MLAHVFALTGFLLLRRTGPNGRARSGCPPIWVPIAGVLAAANLLFIVSGGFIYADKYGYGWDKTLVGIIVLSVAHAVRVPPRRPGPDGHPAARGHADAAGGESHRCAAAGLAGASSVA